FEVRKAVPIGNRIARGVDRLALAVADALHASACIEFRECSAAFDGGHSDRITRATVVVGWRWGQFERCSIGSHPAALYVRIEGAGPARADHIDGRPTLSE